MLVWLNKSKKLPPMPSSNINYAPSSWQYSLKASLALLMGATVIAIAFYIIHSARVNEALSTTKLMAAAIFDHEDSQAENYIPRLRLKAQSLLAFRNVHAVALMSQKGEMLFSAGLPISPKVINDIRQGALSVKQGNLLTFTSPIGDSHSS